MKIIGYKWVVLAAFSVCGLSAAAQNELTVKVTNIPSSKGRVMVATDKGQYNMVDAQGGDAVLKK